MNTINNSIALELVKTLENIEEETQEELHTFNPDSNYLERNKRISDLRSLISEIIAESLKDIVTGYLSAYYVIQNGVRTNYQNFSDLPEWRNGQIGENDNIIYHGDLYITGQPDCGSIAGEFLHLNDLCIGQWSCKKFPEYDPEYNKPHYSLQDSGGYFQVTRDEYQDFLKSLDTVSRLRLSSYLP